MLHQLWVKFASSPVDPSREIRVVEILDVMYNASLSQSSFKGMKTHHRLTFSLTKTGFQGDEGSRI